MKTEQPAVTLISRRRDRLKSTVQPGPPSSLVRPLESVLVRYKNALRITQRRRGSLELKRPLSCADSRNSTPAHPVRAHSPFLSCLAGKHAIVETSDYLLTAICFAFARFTQRVGH